MAAVSSQRQGASSCWPRSPLPAELYKDILLNEEEIFFLSSAWRVQVHITQSGSFPTTFPIAQSQEMPPCTQKSPDYFMSLLYFT